VIARRLHQLLGPRVVAWTRPWAGRAGAPLLHWLVLLSGLALLTTGDVISDDAFVSLFMGAVVGTACGQAFASLRLRVWSAILATLLLVSIVAMSVARFHGALDGMLEAFLPAVACGYLSLTGRSALASFWFPTVPWALALIGADDATASAPSWLLWGGLGGLLAATLWARERRRVEQWKTHALNDLAEPAEQVVLRDAPLRKEARLAWTVGVSIATVLLAAWIAPLLRRYEPGQSGERVADSTSHEPIGESDFITDFDDDYEGPLQGICCPNDTPVAPPPRRVREYVTPRDTRPAEPLLAGVTPATASCVPCDEDAPSGSDHALARARTGFDTRRVEVDSRVYERERGGREVPIPGTTAAPPLVEMKPATLSPPPATTTPPPQRTAEAPRPAKTAAPPPPPQKTAETPRPARTAEPPRPARTAEPPRPARTAEVPRPAKTAETPARTAAEKERLAGTCEGGPCTASASQPTRVAVPFPAKAAPPRIDRTDRSVESVPRPKSTATRTRIVPRVESDHSLLRVLLAALVAACAVHLVLRPIRRWFILRHLRRPWWDETVSQRVSNLWHLALLGLRDAGWRAEPGEPPQHLATRVGVEGMKLCAEVLERARHGVRVDAEDVAAMQRAAERAFAAARARVGLLARIASWWRSPSA
jgi:hypothetical protein